MPSTANSNLLTQYHYNLLLISSTPALLSHALITSV